MVDLREPSAVLRTLADAKRRSEKGAPVSFAVRDLLVELADAVANSGPLELGVSPRRWVYAHYWVSVFVATLGDPNAVRSADTAARTIRELQSLFRRAVWSARWRALMPDSRWAPLPLFVPWSALLALATRLIESRARGQFSARRFAPAILFELFFFLFSAAWLWSATEAAVARGVAGKVAPGERWLLNCRTKNGRVVIATDQRVLAAKGGRDAVGSRLLWSVSYDEVAASVKDPHVVLLRAGGQARQIELREKWHFEALVRILSRRTDPMKGVLSEPPSEIELG